MAKELEDRLMSADLRPAYYDDFKCLMGGCRLNCCMASWRISFSKKDYLTLKKQKGSPELNARLEGCLRRIRGKGLDETTYAEFVMEHGSCPLLGEGGLCRLQQEKGFQVLPHVCRSFPRQEIAGLSEYLEHSLSPACEGVLALLWDLPEGVDFRSDPIPREQWGSLRIPEDEHLTPHFQDIRALCIDFLQDRRRPLPQRILLMGLALKALAEGEEDVPRWLDKGRLILEQGDAAELLKGLDASQARDLVLHNNILTVLAMQSVADAMELLVKMSRWLTLDIHDDQMKADTSAYQDARTRYQERFGDRDYFMENLMVALLFYLKLPALRNREKLWKSYVNFCNIYAIYHFAAVMSCREGSPADREELFRLLVLVSRALIHSGQRQADLRDQFFQNDSSTLAHMALLLCGA